MGVVDEVPVVNKPRPPHKQEYPPARRAPKRLRPPWTCSKREATTKLPVPHRCSIGVCFQGCKTTGGGTRQTGCRRCTQDCRQQDGTCFRVCACYQQSYCLLPVLHHLPVGWIRWHECSRQTHTLLELAIESGAVCPIAQRPSWREERLYCMQYIAE